MQAETMALLAEEAEEEANRPPDLEKALREGAQLVAELRQAIRDRAGKEAATD